MEGLVRATGKAIQDGHRSILCVADSQAALRGILSTAPRSGQYRAIQYDTPVRRSLLAAPDLAIILNLWTPAHIGTYGNELADEAAKESTVMEPDLTAYVSLTSVRRGIHTQVRVLHSWDESWKRSKTGDALRQIDRSPPSLRPIPLYSSTSISRRTSSTIAQLRTGQSYLNAYRFKAGFIDSPACDACGAPFETRAHFLLECPVWEPLRQPLHRASKAAGLFGPLHLTPLLSNPKLLKATAKFVESKGCLRHTAVPRRRL
jgi:hypothetical protein